jgi:hypothetical protein
MAILTEKRRSTRQKLPMVAPMGFMADQAALLHRGMLPHKRPSFFGVAFVTKVVDRISLYHFICAGPAGTAETDDRLGAKTAHRIVATRALERLSPDKRFLDGMMGLLIGLSPDISMTVEAKVRLGGHQQVFHSPVDGMAAIAGIARKLVPVHVPERQCLRFFVAGHAFRRFFLRAYFFTKGKDDNASASALFNVLSTGTVAGFTSVPVSWIPGHCLFAMDGFYKFVVIGLMATLASLRTGVL